MSIKTYQGLLDSYNIEGNGKIKRQRPKRPLVNNTEENNNTQSIYQRNIAGKQGRNPNDIFMVGADGTKVLVKDGGTYNGEIQGGSGNGGEQGGGQKPETVDNSWQSIQQQIKLNTLNSKNELAIAQRHASKNMDNYLKALGIYGTGLGQSQYTGLASQYANQLAEINTEEREAMLGAIEEQNDKVKELIDMETNDPTTVDNIIANLKAQGFDTSEIEAHQKMRGQDLTTLATRTYEGMLNDIETGEFKGNRTDYEQAITMLENALNSGDKNSLKQAYDYAKNVYNGTPNLNNGTQSGQEGQGGLPLSTKASEFLSKPVDDRSISFSEMASSYRDINFDLETHNETHNKIDGLEKNLFYNGIDDDLDITLNGHTYNLDVDWTYGGNQGITNGKEFNRLRNKIVEIYGYPENNEIVVLNGRLWLYSADKKIWGIIQDNGSGTANAGRNLRKDFEKAIKGEKPSNWK
jgi:hypothetical protein